MHLICKNPKNFTGKKKAVLIEISMKLNTVEFNREKNCLSTVSVLLHVYILGRRTKAKLSPPSMCSFIYMYVY